MATIINNPDGSGEGSGVGMIVGVLVAIILIVLFFVYGLPALRGGAAPQNNGLDVNVSLPGGNGGGTSGGTSGGTQ
jgi:flagellar biogenesis protein FliO